MREDRDRRWDQLLELLADEVADRLRTRVGIESVLSDRDPALDEGAVRSPHQEQSADPAETTAASEPQPKAEVFAELEPETLGTEPMPEPPPTPPGGSHTARLLGRLALGLLTLVIIINIPISRHGTTLATAMPDRRALVIRDGLVIKEMDDPEIYVYQDRQFRWISSLKAFEMHGYTWEDVHVVEDGFLEPFEIGPPIHVILKCPDSPHIYRLEGEKKRWIVDIAAFEAEGYVWEDVTLVPCSYLRSLPDGDTIPPDQGPPPQP